MKKQPKITDCITCRNLANSSWCSIGNDDLKEINNYKQTHYLKKNQIVFHEDETAKGLYCVYKGKIKLYKTFADGNTQILRISKESDLIGYRGLLGDGKYIATGVAIEDSTVCFVPKERIFELIAKNVNFTLQIMAKLAHDLSLAENKSVSFIQKNSGARLAETLLLLEKSFGKTSENYINILLSREEIASISGMATETAVRFLHQWEQNNFIELNKKHIGILKANQLYKIAEVEE